MHQGYRLRRAEAGLAILCLLAGCGQSVTGAGPGDPEGDGGRSARDGGSAQPDGGRPRILWPEPTLIVEDATAPYLVRSPSGDLTLIYRQNGKIWAHRNPPEGAPVEVADAPGTHVETSVAASPTEDRIFIAWSGRNGVSLTGGQPDGPRFELCGGLADLSAFGASWIDGLPAVSAFTNEVWYGSDHFPPTFLAFTVPIDAPASLPLPEPQAANLIDASANPYHHYGESHRILDLGEDKWLLFRTQWRSDPEDPSGEKHFAQWHRLTKSYLASGSAKNYLVSAESGLMELPSWAAWIQPHALEDGNFALTWGSSESSLVYDVFIAGLAFAEDGTPSLTTAPVNVSMTTGMTQNSDHAILHSTGEGRYWIAWRETDYGPRVGLLDGQDFHPLVLGGPSSELMCSMSSSIGAQVDAEGTLHLVAGFNDGSLRVGYFRIRLP